MKIIKKLFLVALSAGLLSVPSQLEKVEAANITGNTNLYLIPGTWDASSARFSAYFYNNSSNNWVSMSDSYNDGIFEVSAPAGTWSNVIFCRMNPSTTENKWDNKWNQTGNLTYDGSNNLFKVTQWDSQTTGWTKYNSSTFNIAGSFNGWNLEAMNQRNGIFEYSVTLEKNEYKFKLNCGEWLGNNGTIENTTYNTSVDGWSFNINEGDCTLKATGGTYVFKYNSLTNKLIVENIHALFNSYYNDGSYTKDSILYTNEMSDAETKKYFHASADIKYRRTVYSSNGLTMTTSTDGDTYSGESTYTNDNGKVKHTGIGGTYTVNKASVEDWFVTLYDFKNASAEGWSYDNGVYSYNLKAATATTEDEMTRMAREFVAPMWLAPNSENFAYAPFNKLTVSVENDKLVMRLFTSTTDAGKLSSTDGLFSQVTIY